MNSDNLFAKFAVHAKELVPLVFKHIATTPRAYIACVQSLQLTCNRDVVQFVQCLPRSFVNRLMYDAQWPISEQVCLASTSTPRGTLNKRRCYGLRDDYQLANYLPLQLKVYELESTCSEWSAQNLLQATKDNVAICHVTLPSHGQRILQSNNAFNFVVSLTIDARTITYNKDTFVCNFTACKTLKYLTVQFAGACTEYVQPCNIAFETLPPTCCTVQLLVAVYSTTLVREMPVVYRSQFPDTVTNFRIRGMTVVGTFLNCSIIVMDRCAMLCNVNATFTTFRLPWVRDTKECQNTLALVTATQLARKLIITAPPSAYRYTMQPSFYDAVAIAASLSHLVLQYVRVSQALVTAVHSCSLNVLELLFCSVSLKREQIQTITNVCHVVVRGGYAGNNFAVNIAALLNNTDKRQKTLRICMSRETHVDQAVVAMCPVVTLKNISFTTTATFAGTATLHNVLGSVMSCNKQPIIVRGKSSISIATLAQFSSKMLCMGEEHSAMLLTECMQSINMHAISVHVDTIKDRCMTIAFADYFDALQLAVDQCINRRPFPELNVDVVSPAFVMALKVMFALTPVDITLPILPRISYTEQPLNITKHWSLPWLTTEWAKIYTLSRKQHSTRTLPN